VRYLVRPEQLNFICALKRIGQNRLRGEDVVAALLDRIAVGRPLPRFIKADNGSEFIFKVLDKWVCERGVKNRLLSLWQANR
jgi:hypothetical protein